MSNNPLLGNRISLISKKSIRYEGTLYSINEADATVALADVRSYGTEGREKLDPSAAYVPPQDAVHPYLLFRGCDIKDLHVHERQDADAAPPTDPAILSTEAPPDVKAKQLQQLQQQQKEATDDAPRAKQQHEQQQQHSKQHSNQQQNERDSKPAMKHSPETQQNGHRQTNSYSNGQQQPHPGKNQQQHKQQQQQRSNSTPRSSSRNGGFSRRPRKHDNLVGTGASLLHRKARGAVQGSLGLSTGKDFDFESSAAEFDEVKSSTSSKDGDQEQSITTAYTKDNFFDSISCDAIDKRDGVDNRLRGAAERNLNTETFGAVSLGNGRRGGRRHRRGGGNGGRGNGGRGNGGGRHTNTNNNHHHHHHHFSGPRENQRWKRHDSDGSAAAATERRNSSGPFAQPPTARAGGDR